MEIYEEHKLTVSVDFTAALKINFSSLIMHTYVVYQYNESPIDTQSLYLSVKDKFQPHLI